MAPLTDIKVVIFDLDDTLCDYEGAKFGGLSAAAELLATGEETAAAIAQRYRAIEPDLFRQYLRKELSLADYREQRFARGVVARRDPDLLRAANSAYMAIANGPIALFEDALRTVAGVGDRGLVAAILSNGPTDGQRAKLAMTGLAKVFDHVFISEELGLAKPDPQAFLAVAQRLGVAPAECLMVGDSLEVDVAGALAAGMRALHLDRTRTAAGSPRHGTISTLDDIFAVIDGPGDRPRAEVDGGQPYRLAYAGAAITLEAGGAVIDYLRANLGPYVAFTSGNDPRLPIAVTVILDADTYGFWSARCLNDASEELRLHGRMPGFRIEADGADYVLNVGGRAVYRLQREFAGLRLEVICDAMSTLVQMDVLRLVRGILTSLVVRNGGQRVHLSAVVRRQQAVAFVGPPGAGKTSFALAALKHGWADKFLTNDKALVSADAPGEIIGIPYAVSIGDGALAQLPELTGLSNTRRISRETYIWPADLASALGVVLCPRASIGLLISPRLDLARATPLIERIDADDVVDEIVQFTEDMHPEWLEAYFGAPRPAPSAWRPAWPVEILRVTMDPWRAQSFEILDAALEGLASRAG
jgi:putative hydrolase of the HAD superfamily